MSGMIITSACYANDENSAVIVMTTDRGAVAISQVDHPADWDDLIASGIEIGPYTPAQLTLKIIAKADIWRRLTDAEAESVDAALQAAPLRLRRIFEAAQYLDNTDPDYPALRAGLVTALGELRAAEVLSPTY